MERDTDAPSVEQAAKAMREKTLNDYDFGYDDGSNQPPEGAAPKWFRDYMEKAGEENKALREKLDQLQRKEQQAELTQKFKAAGVNPGAAALFSGEPEKVDDWLKANGEYLAKLPSAGAEEEQQAPAGPPASTVDTEGQAQMQRMAEAGASGAAEPQGSEKELAAALAAARTPEEFGQLMRAHGNQHDWGA